MALPHQSQGTDSTIGSGLGVLSLHHVFLSRSLMELTVQESIPGIVRNEGATAQTVSDGPDRRRTNQDRVSVRDQTAIHRPQDVRESLDRHVPASIQQLSNERFALG